MDEPSKTDGGVLAEPPLGDEHLAGRGHTLVELLVVVALIGTCATASLLSVGRAAEVTEARGAARSWQAGATAAQLRSLWVGRSAALEAGSAGLMVTDTSHGSGFGEFDHLGDVGVAPTPGVARWRTSEGARVTFSAGLAAPDSGGSLDFGDTAWGSRVIVRVESGLTRRAKP